MFYLNKWNRNIGLTWLICIKKQVINLLDKVFIIEVFTKWVNDVDWEPRISPLQLTEICQWPKSAIAIPSELFSLQFVPEKHQNKM